MAKVHHATVHAQRQQMGKLTLTWSWRRSVSELVVSSCADGVPRLTGRVVLDIAACLTSKKLQDVPYINE